MKAYLSNLSAGTLLLLVLSAMIVAYPIVEIVVPAVVHAVVPEVVRTVLNVL